MFDLLWIIAAVLVVLRAIGPIHGLLFLAIVAVLVRLIVGHRSRVGRI